MRALRILLLVSLAAAAQVPRTDPGAAKLIGEIRGAVNGREALDFVVRLHEKDRWSNFAKFQESARYLETTMREIGLSEGELLSTPADGVTQFGFWTMPLAWDVKEARLEVMEPEFRVLADYRKEPASLVMWSGPTPPGGVVAEVVELRPATLARLDALEVKGKMVLADIPRDLAERGALKAALYRKGAAGLVSDATENPDLVNSHNWINAWGDHGWAFTKTSSPLPGFSITPRHGAWLRGLLAGGATVRVRAVSDTRYYSGDYPYVTGVVPGTGGGEEVLALGHGFETGAQDNATGAAAMLEMAAALNRLIAAGRLPRPRRSIRVLVMPEDYGSSAYIAANMERMKRTIGAICVDTAAGPYEETGAYGFHMNPDVNRSYQDALVMRLAENYYAGMGRRFPRWFPYRAFTDSFLSDPTIGVPTLTALGSNGAVNVHHNSADTLDRVDPRSLADLSSLLAAFFYYLAAAGEDEIPWLAEITVDRAYDNAIRAAAPFLSRVAAADAGALGRELHGGLAKIAYEAERDSEALATLERLAAPGNRERVRARLRGPLDRIRRFSDDQRERLQQAVDRRAAALGALVPVQAAAPPADPRRAAAAGMVVTRKRFGPVTLDDLPLERREGFPGFGSNPAPLPLLLWCDGKRDLAEVIRLVELEHGPMNFDFVGYFRFLAKHGYVEVTAKGR